MSAVEGRFAGRVVAVTGGAGGIGRATALRFAAEGARVAVLDLEEKTAARAAAELGADEACGIGVNVTDAESVEKAMDEVIDRLGGVHVVVNNAGVTRDNLLFRMSEQDWDDVIAVHLRGAFLISRAAQRTMVEQKFGRIINISSIAALGNRGQANYSAAKAGLQGFTRTLAIELGPFGVTVNSVGPGFIATDMTDATARRMGQEPEAYRAAAAADTPLRRIGYPEDVAGVSTFLASDDASFVTGQNIYVDGGMAL